MKKIVFIAVLVYLAFLAEFVLYNTFGAWGKPQLMVLVVIFCGLYWGIRHSIWAAFAAGMLKDSFGIDPFGTYVLIYIIAAFLTTLIRRNFYQPGSRLSRVIVALCVLAAVFVMEALLHARFFEVHWAQAAGFVLMPQLFSTLLVATFVFQSLRGVAARL